MPAHATCKTVWNSCQFLVLCEAGATESKGRSPLFMQPMLNSA